MPRYVYGCDECEEEFIVMHSISATVEECAFCGSESIRKLVGKPSYLKKAQREDAKVGKMTNDYIEQNRELLKQMKEESANESLD